MRASLSEGHKWKAGGLTSSLPYQKVEILFPLLLSVREAGTEKQILLIKQINTSYMPDTVLSVSCIWTYLIVNVTSEVDTTIIPLCDWGNQGLKLFNK